MPDDVDYDAIILAVGHSEFTSLDLHSIIRPKSIIYDVKGILDRTMIDGRL